MKTPVRVTLVTAAVLMLLLAGLIHVLVSQGSPAQPLAAVVFLVAAATMKVGRA